MGLLLFLSLKPFQEALPLRSLSLKSGVGLDVSLGLIQLRAGGARSPIDASLPTPYRCPAQLSWATPLAMLLLPPSFLTEPWGPVPSTLQ